MGVQSWESNQLFSISYPKSEEILFRCLYKMLLDIQFVIKTAFFNVFINFACVLTTIKTDDKTLTGSKSRD